MKAILILSLISICIYSALTANINDANVLKPLEPSESYTHDLSFDEDDDDLYKMYWKLLNKDEIQFEIHCRTSGWVGLGFSPNGNMQGDIVIGWVDSNGKGFLKVGYFLNNHLWVTYSFFTLINLLRILMQISNLNQLLTHSKI